MTYHEFKFELWDYISKQAQGAGIRVILLNKGYSTQEQWMRNSIIRINYLYFTSCAEELQEDFLIAVWPEGNYSKSTQWPVKRCFAKFLAESWQGVLPPILNVIYEKEDVITVPPIATGNINVQGYLNGKGSAGDYLKRYAIWNASVMFPAKLYKSDDLLYWQEISGRLADEAADYPDLSLTGGFLRLTTDNKDYGTAAIRYPGILEKLAILLQGDFYVYPAENHEVVLFPVRQELYRRMRYYMEEQALSIDEERLGRRLCRYLWRRRELVEV